MTPQRMDELVDAHIGAEASNDVTAAVAVYTDDVEHDVVGAPDGVLHGPDAASHRYEQLLKELRQDELITARRHHGEDFCVVEHKVTCTVTGQFAGIPGNGRQVSFRMLHLFEFREDAISRENVWMDTTGAMAQLRA